MGLAGVQEAIWQRREERMRQIVAAWEERCSRPAEVRQKAAPKAAWPSQFPSRSHRQRGERRIANGRACGLMEFCRERREDAFWIVDLGCVEKLYAAFRASLPRVEPFYAVKCLPEARVVRRLEELGCGFDCASAREVELVGSAEIILANPCKREAELAKLRSGRVSYTTFDCVEELRKLVGTACKPILRIRADDPDSRLPFGAKYGATPDEARDLLAVAERLGLAVKGVSFHVGSGARTARAYRAAIEAARAFFEPGFEVLDIGGGFCGDFDERGRARISAAGDASLADVVNRALDEFFPVDEWPGLRIFAEPGRYFAESAAAFCSRVVGARDRGHLRERWIADGVYGAFNAIIYDAWLPHAVVVDRNHSEEEVKDPARSSEREHEDSEDAGASTTTTTTTTTVFGPTCDSLDIIFHKVPNAPAIRLDDQLLFPSCGAYTLAGATDFNGIPATQAPRFYLASDSMALTERDKQLPLIYSAKPPMECVRYFD